LVVVMLCRVRAQRKQDIVNYIHGAADEIEISLPLKNCMMSTRLIYQTPKPGCQILESA
jgi:hypothetical protein